MKKCLFHRWVTGGHIESDYETYCIDCNKQSTVSAYGWLPLFFDGGIRWEKNPKGFTKKNFKRLSRHIFNNLADECKE